MKIRINDKGYTLIELLAVLTLIVAIGSIVLAIILSSLRATKKSNNIITVSENGNFATSQMTRTIQYARTFNGASVDGETDFENDCTLGSGTTQYKAVQVTTFDDIVTTYTCSPTISPPTTISVQSDLEEPVDLINTEIISMTSCYFTCSQANQTDPPSIGILFDLKHKNADVSDANSVIPFNTTVTMRNINK